MNIYNVLCFISFLKKINSLLDRKNFKNIIKTMNQLMGVEKYIVSKDIKKPLI